MDIWWIFLILTLKAMVEHSGSDLTNSDSIFQTELSTKNVGWIKYRDGKVLISQNKKKQTDFFFTPFPYLEREESQCKENIFSGRTELKLEVELYTQQLEQSVKDYLHKHQLALCGNETSSSVCDISLVPMNSIRLAQSGSHSNGTNRIYTLDENWKPATLLLQSMKFVIYAPNMTVCQQLLRAVTEECQLPDLEVQYSLHGQQTVQRQLEVNTEHVTSTNMYNQIRAQFPTAETMVLTGGDFKELISESIDRITMILRVQEGFENLQDPMAIDKHLERQLSTQQVRLEMMNDKLWENLYWTSESTRPDRFAKILNTIIRKQSGNNEDFIYDRQAVRDAIKIDLTQHDIAEADTLHRDNSGIDTARIDIDRADLKQHDIDDVNSSEQSGSRIHLMQHDKRRLGQLDKLFDSHSRSSSASNFQNDNGEAKGRLNVFGLFNVGGGYGGVRQTGSKSSDNRADVSNREHGKLSDTDTLNAVNTDKNDLNVLGSRRNHLNSTRIDKEHSDAANINNNHFNQTEMNINNFNETKLNKNTENQHTLSRHGVVKFLRALSGNVELASDMIKPRPINARLVKIGKLRKNTKLFSNTVLVRMRSNVNSLPLRCKPKDHGGKSKLWPTDRVDRVENVLQNLTNHVETTRLNNEIRNAETIVNWKQVIDDLSSNMHTKIDNLYANLTKLMNQTINDTYNKINIEINNVTTKPTQISLPGLQGTGFIVVRHSQSAQVPECPSGMIKLYDGYSFLMMQGNGHGYHQDLGSAGSCLQKFSVLPYIHCDHTNVCYYGQTNDLTYYLSTAEPMPMMPVQRDQIRPYISRCAVCEAPANVMSFHSLSMTPPPCPGGWNILWQGYSFVMHVGRGAQGGGQSLSSPGSCLEDFRATPFIECSGTDGNCMYYANKFSYWMTVIDQNNQFEVPRPETLKSGNHRNKIGRCTVCLKTQQSIGQGGYQNGNYYAGHGNNYMGLGSYYVGQPWKKH